MLNPVLLKTLTTAVTVLLPKILGDAYDYCFNDETIQVRKKPDTTKFNAAQIAAVKDEYKFYLNTNDDLYTSQQELTDGINKLLNTNKSVAQIMRICRS